MSGNKSNDEKKTTDPTRSSNAAIGMMVLVTGPFVFISRTTDKEGAGAVAKAIPPNINAKYKGMCVK